MIAAIALLISAPAFAGVAPVIDEFIATPAVIAPGETTTISIAAHDPDCADVCTSGCGTTIRADLTGWTVSGGTKVSENDGTTGSPYTASMVWQAPDTEGVYTISVYLGDSGGFMCGGRESINASIDVIVSLVINDPPIIDSVTATPSRIFPDETSSLTAVASDPDGDSFTYAWTTDLGTVVPTGFGTAEFTAPPTTGIATITCTATDSQDFSSSKTTTIIVTGVEAEREITAGLITPQKVALTPAGDLLVADSAAGGLQRLNFYNGNLIGTTPIAGITSVAVDWQGRTVVGGDFGAKVINASGVTLQQLYGGPSQVTDVAVDPVLQRYAMLLGDASKVVVFDSAGTIELMFGGTGDAPEQFRTPKAIAFGPAGEIVVADSGHGQIKIFDPTNSTGVPTQVFGAIGPGAGEFMQLIDVEVADDGVIFATDAFQSWVMAFEWDGTVREAIGTYGSDVGEFQTPTGALASTDLDRLIVTSLNGSSLQVFKLTRGGGPGGPIASVTPASLNFPDQVVGSASAPLSVVLSNTGTNDLQFYSASASGDYSQTNDCPAILVPGSQCTFDITFTPNAMGLRTGFLEINHGAAGSPSQVALSGTGVAAGALTLSPQALVFPDTVVDSASAPQTITISNTGSGDVAISSLQTTGSFVLTNDCPSVLIPSTSCSANITFAPPTLGAHAGLLTVVSDAPGSPQSATLNGIGVEPPAVAQLSPAVVAFGDIGVGTPSATQTLGLTNVGGQVLTVSAVGLQGTHPADFIIQTDTCTGTPLSGGSSCTIVTAFNPSAAGARQASLVVTTDDAAGSHASLLQGVGIESTLSVTPATVNFGTVGMGQTSDPDSFSITNSGPASIAVGTALLGGPAANDYLIVSDSCSESILTAGANCTISLTLTPTVVGDRTAWLDLPSTDPTTPMRLTLRGNGLGPTVVFDPVALNFGDVGVDGVGRAVTVSLSNGGFGDPLTVQSIAIVNDAGSDFMIDDEDCTGASLEHSASCSITLRFSPTAYGSRTAQVEVFSNDVVNPGGMNLSGTGADAADLALTITTPGTAPVPGQGLVYSLRVQNNGTTDAEAVRFTATVPQVTTFDAARSADGWVCTADGIAGDECTLDVGSILVGKKHKSSFAVLIDQSIPVSTTEIVLNARVDSMIGVPDLNPADNAATFATPLDRVSPKVASVAKGLLGPCQSLQERISSVELQFTEAMFDPAGDEENGDVTNPLSYLIVAAGADADFQTDQCGSVFGDDVGLEISSVTWNIDTLTSTVRLLSDMPSGTIRVMACGSLGLADLSGNPLDGTDNGQGGDDFVLMFRSDPENDLVNGNFDCGLDGWSLASNDPSEIIFGDYDSDESTISGSARITNLSGGTTFELSQCAVARPGQELPIKGQIMIDATSGFDGELIVETEFMRSSDCSGDAASVTNMHGKIGDTNETWVPINGVLETPQGTKSVRYIIRIETPSGSDFDLWIDSLRVDRSAILYINDFEAGDLSTWSTVVGD